MTRPPPDSLKRHMSLSLAELVTKSMEPVELEFPSESHAGRRKRLNEASYQPERQFRVLTVSDLAGDCSLEKEGWAHTTADRTLALHLNLDLLPNSPGSHLLVSLPNVATQGLLRVVAKWLSVAARAQALTRAQIMRPANFLGENSSWNKFTVGKNLLSHCHPPPSLSPNAYASPRYP